MEMEVILVVMEMELEEVGGGGCKGGDEEDGGGDGGDGGLGWWRWSDLVVACLRRLPVVVVRRVEGGD